MFRSVFFMAIIVAVMSFGATSFLANRITQSGKGPFFSISPPAAMQRQETAQPAARSGGYGELAIAPDRSGNFFTNVDIDGHSIRMVVDTGATYVSLTNGDAAAVGLRPTAADFIYRTMTANGTGVAAKVRINQLRIGSMEIYDVDAFVMPPGVLGTSLLGMSALRQLGSVQISGGQLVLRQ